METLKKYKDTFLLTAGAVFAAVCVGAVIYYIIFPSAAFLHSDCTDTILWAKASVDGKTLFNPDFGYAALLPFGGTLIMTPLVAIFGYTLGVHHAGMIIFSLLFFAGLFFLCRNAGFGNAYSFFVTGACAMVLASSEKLREIFYEHVIYYSICVLMICLLLGLILGIRRNGIKSTKSIVLLVLSALVSFLGALDGAQMLATGIFPVLFALALSVLLNKEKLFSNKNYPLMGIAGFIVSGTAAGYGVLSILTKNINAGYADAYSGYSNMSDWMSNLLKFPEQWFSLFGVNAEYGMPIFSVESVLNIIRIGAALLIAAVPFAGLFLYKKLGDSARMLVLTHFGLAGVIMFGYVFGILSAANWRLSPLICTGLLTCAAIFYELRLKMVPRRIFVCFCVLLAMVSVISAHEILTMPKNGKEENPRQPIIEMLEANGLRNGFATFWNSQTITLLSDSRVRASNIDVNENGIAPCPYQTNKNEFEPVEGETRYFVLLSDSEYDILSGTEDIVKFRAMTREIIPTNLGYTVFVFDSPEVLN